LGCSPLGRNLLWGQKSSLCDNWCPHGAKRSFYNRRRFLGKIHQNYLWPQRALYFPGEFKKFFPPFKRGPHNKVVCFKPPRKKESFFHTRHQRFFFSRRHGLKSCSLSPRVLPASSLLFRGKGPFLST